MIVYGFADFDKAFKCFEADAWAVHYDHHFDGGQRKEDFNRQFQAQEIAEDVGFACMMLRDVVLDLSLRVQNEMNPNSLANRNPSQPLTSKETSMQHTKMAVMMKYLIFSIRAYQDAVYKVGASVFGMKNGKGSTMKKAIDADKKVFQIGNPVAEIIKSQLPEYLDWYCELREWRNLIKLGQGAGHGIRQDFVKQEVELTIRLSDRFNREKQIDLGLPYVSSALNMSAKLTQLFIKHGVQEKVFVK